MTDSLPDVLPRDHAGLKQLAAELGCAKKDLMILSPQNDPYNADTPAKRRDAEWFVELWDRFGYTNGVHVRRVHYRAERAGDVLTPNGMPYVNTDECWTVMANAAVAARDLGLIDPRQFVDRRNPRTNVNVASRYDDPMPDWQVTYGDHPLDDWYGAAPWRLPRINVSSLAADGFSVGRVNVDGYDYTPADQPFMLELWIEKSTMDDVLAPLCSRLGVNYTPGIGFPSKTRIAEMLRRGHQHGKPVRVFVITDYDPAGSHMPFGISRNIEFYRDLIAPDVEFAVHHIGMGREWVGRYDLSRTPIKADDKRKARFEAIHGEGAVELDALEAVAPGALADEVQAEIEGYLDDDYPADLAGAERSARSAANEQWHAITHQLRAELDQVSRDAGGVADRYHERLAALADELDAEMRPYQESIDGLWQRLRDLSATAFVDLPDRPEPHAVGSDETNWLYRSDRHWQDQLDRYRQERNGGNP